MSSWQLTPLLALNDRLAGFVGIFNRLNYSATVGLGLAITWLISIVLSDRKRPNAPVYGYRSILEPTWLLESRFIMGARSIVKEAYKQMKDRPFVLRRWDVDFLVLPSKYLDEIRLMSTAKLSSKGAQAGNLAPEYTNVQFIIHSNLHLDVLKKKLTPELFQYVDMAKEEMDYGWDIVMPKNEEYKEVLIEYLMRELVARMTARIFMGKPASRSLEWLKISVDFSVDLFTTAFTIKMFPPWLYGIVVWLIPAKYRTIRQMKTASRIVGELTDKHNDAKRRRALGEKVEEEDTLLNWMLDHGKPSEVEVGEMGIRQCVLTLASIHTTASNIANMIFDLCQHPEYFDILRQEIDEVAKELGPPGTGLNSKGWCHQLEKMDSLFMESQRMNPVLLLGPQRLAYEDITLKDGTFIPKGSRIAFPMLDRHLDPDVHPDPLKFDPLRSYRKRQANEDQRNQHRAGMTHPDHLGFGYGNQACAGRQFAVAEIKIILSRLLYEYDFKFIDGMKRPEAQYINENAFTDQSAKVLIRKRKL